ncbi:hypothetical protein [Pseudomonas zeae]|uniref:hypothetical protein n=1 Tax=Pseudomonas zeae TaxID=2745510 RepID=UPI0039DFB364
MNLLTIPCIHLPGSCPHARVIPALELQEHFQAAAALTRAQEACKDLHDQARLVLEQAQNQAENIRQEAYQQGLQDAAQTLAAQQQSLVEETLDWHVSQARLEATLAQHLDTRIRAMVAAVLEEFIGEQVAADLIVKRVQRRLSDVLSAGTVTLHVSDSCQPQACEELGAYPHVRIVTCTSLQPRQARVQTPLFTLHIDLDKHLNSLLSRLRQPANEPACDDYQDRAPEPQTSHPGATGIATPPHWRDADLSCAISA